MIGRATKRAKLTRALLLRDAAVTVLTRHGVWKAFRVARQTASGGNEIKALSARIGGLEISYRTPFQRVPEPNDGLRYLAVQHGVTVRNLPYGLDVWAPKKVLNIEWNDNGS